MNSALANIIGLVGTAIFIGAFAYANLTESLDKLLFNLANLAGAICLLTSLAFNFNLAAFVLEAAWGVISTIGLLAAIRTRLRRPNP